MWSMAPKKRSKGGLSLSLFWHQHPKLPSLLSIFFGSICVIPSPYPEKKILPPNALFIFLFLTPKKHPSAISGTLDEGWGKRVRERENRWMDARVFFFSPISVGVEGRGGRKENPTNIASVNLVMGCSKDFFSLF